MSSRDPLIVGNIVGDIVDYFDASARLKVLYSSREITVGSELRPSHVANQPTLQITGLSRSLCTLVSDDYIYIYVLINQYYLKRHYVRIMPASACRYVQI